MGETRSNVVYVVIEQTLGSQYDVVGVYGSFNKAFAVIADKVDSTWDTDHDACDRGMCEVGRWVNERLNCLLTINEELVRGE